MRRLLIGLGVMTMATACDKPGMGSDGHSGPSMSDSGVGGGSTGGTGGSGNLPPTSTTTATSTGGTATGGTVGCGAEDTAADPWGDEDGCDGELPTQSPWDVGGGGNCWMQLDHWDASCEDAPCLDYDCQTPSPCGPVTFGECSPGGNDTDDDGDATTGGSELYVDDPAALECILEALRDQVPIRYTINDCDSLEPSTTYEVVANGLVITTIEEAFGDHHSREQRISTFNDEYDFASCVGAGADNREKRWCVGMADAGPCPVGPVACPAE